MLNKKLVFYINYMLYNILIEATPNSAAKVQLFFDIGK